MELNPKPYDYKAKSLTTQPWLHLIRVLGRGGCYFLTLGFEVDKAVNIVKRKKKHGWNISKVDFSNSRGTFTPGVGRAPSIWKHEIQISSKQFDQEGQILCLAILIASSSSYWSSHEALFFVGGTSSFPLTSCLCYSRSQQFSSPVTTFENEVRIFQLTTCI